MVPAALQLLLSRIPPARLTHIVDVGANPINPPPYDLLRQIGAVHVTGFEPSAAAFATLQENAGPHETNFNLAVGDGKTRDLHLYVQEPMTSIFAPNLPALASVSWARQGAVRGKVAFDTVALDDVPELAPFDMMKIDIQGGEKLAFAGAKRMLRDAICVIVELRYLRLYRGEPMMGGVDSALLRQGFGLHKFLFNKSRMMLHSQSHRVKRRHMADQLIDGDAVYLRGVSTPDKLTTDQIKHMAILAAGVFHSHSLVLYLLDELVRRGAPDDLPAAYVDALPPDLRKD